MIARTLLTAENVGRGILIWPAHGAGRAPMQGVLKAWSRNFEKVFVELQKDYGKGRRKGSLVDAPRDSCSFSQTDDRLPR
jgi:hypothetical protein